MSTPEKLSMFAPWDGKTRALLAERNEARVYTDLLTGVSVAGAQALGAATALVAASGGTPSTLFNRVIGLGLDAPITSATLQTIDAIYAPGHQRWSLEIPVALCGPELRTLLKAWRYRRSPISTAVFAVACSEPLPIPNTIEVLQIVADASVGADIQALVFDVTHSVRDLLARAPRKASFRQWLACIDGVPAGACLTYVAGETAWFGWSATLPAYRGRGVQPALLAATRRDAAASGCRWMTTETAVGSMMLPDPSYRNMLRAGFTELYRRESFLFTPSRSS